jgi:hypothetical protein
MHSLPRSRTLPLLRTPAPFRVLAGMLGWIALCATVLAAAPALSDRVRLGGVLIDATITRVDPLLEHAATGRWPVAGSIPSATTPPDPTEALARRITADGIAITQTRQHDRVDLRLRYTMTPGDTVFWECEVRDADGGATIDPASLPASCRR